MQIGSEMATLQEKNPKMDPKKRFFWKIPQDFELLKKVPQNSHQIGHFGWNRYIGTLNLPKGPSWAVWAVLGSRNRPYLIIYSICPYHSRCLVTHLGGLDFVPARFLSQDQILYQNCPRKSQNTTHPFWTLTTNMWCVSRMKVYQEFILVQG